MDTLTTAITVATAQVWMGDGRTQQRELPLPHPAAGEVLVEITLATVCGSDRHTVSGRRSSPAPGILGHEAVGTIVDLGPGGAVTIDGSGLALGDRVVWSVAVNCGRCDRCRTDRAAKCRTVRKIGHEPLTEPWLLSGGYATHILLPVGSRIARVPDPVPDAVAAPAACATATVMAAAEAAGPLRGRSMLIIGVGMLGLSAVALASATGAGTITVIDRDPTRRALATRFGAHHVGDHIDGAEFDLVMDFSGAPAMIETTIGLLAVGGRMILVGSVTPSDPVHLDPEQIVRRWLTVTGVHNYEPRHLLEALDLLSRTADHFPWQDLVSPPRPLNELDQILTTSSESTASTGSEINYPRVAVRP